MIRQGIKLLGCWFKAIIAINDDLLCFYGFYEFLWVVDLWIVRKLVLRIFWSSFCDIFGDFAVLLNIFRQVSRINHISNNFETQKCATNHTAFNHSPNCLNFRLKISPSIPEVPQSLILLIALIGCRINSLSIWANEMSWKQKIYF
jgi:hypothetical protein